MLRWLYVRRAPTQAFDIDFGPSVVRLYDEWDALGRKAADPAKSDVATLAWHRASETAPPAACRSPAVPVPFRTLSSVADVTAGSADLISPDHRVLGLPARLGRRPRAAAVQGDAVDGRARARRRAHHGAGDARHRAARLAHARTRSCGCGSSSTGCPPSRDLDAVTSVVYGVPKVARGLGFEDAPTDQVKADQKDFFRLLYNLLVDADRGPRLPTLVLALGPEKVRQLLGA